MLNLTDRYNFPLNFLISSIIGRVKGEEICYKSRIFNIDEINKLYHKYYIYLYYKIILKYINYVIIYI